MLSAGPVWLPALAPLPTTDLLQASSASAPFGYMNTIDMVNKNMYIHEKAWPSYQTDEIATRQHDVKSPFTNSAEQRHQWQRPGGNLQRNTDELQNDGSASWSFNENPENLFISHSGQMYDYFWQKKRKFGAEGFQNRQFTTDNNADWVKQIASRQAELEEQRKEIRDDLRSFILITIPYFFFDRPVASYFLATKLFSILLSKLGYTDRQSMFIMLFLQCVDIRALLRGRFKLVEGYESNWYQEVFDTIVQQLRPPDIVRYGLLMLLPQTPAPTYED